MFLFIFSLIYGILLSATLVGLCFALVYLTGLADGYMPLSKENYFFVFALALSCLAGLYKFLVKKMGKILFNQAMSKKLPKEELALLDLEIETYIYQKNAVKLKEELNKNIPLSSQKKSNLKRI